MREGSLDAPIRHPIDWQSDEFFDETSLVGELERVFDICHGCRRCFNLCNAFPTLFDAVDESDSGELDTVPTDVYWNVVDECYLCDMCYMSKCPYVPPHEWNVDFPHLMLRAKAKRFRDRGASFANRLLADTDRVGTLAGIPVVSEIMNAVNDSSVGRVVLEKTLGVDRSAPVPTYHRNSARSRLANSLSRDATGDSGKSLPRMDSINGRVVLYATCYGDRNTPEICEDLVAVFAHNGIEVKLAPSEKCCGMPKLELGDLDGVARAKDENVPVLADCVREGWDIVAPIPSCVLMYKQELPLLFPDDESVRAVAEAFFDPFEYLAILHKHGHFKTDFEKSLGTVSYQVPCHLRVQNIGLKTKSILEMVPDTAVDAIERCSGHDGTYGVKKRFREASLKIAEPVVRRVEKAAPDHFTSDCPMAAVQIAGAASTTPEHPISLLRRAYAI